MLEAVVKHMPAGVLLADVPSGRIITSNPQTTAIWRKAIGHAQRISDYGLWGGLDEEGRVLDPRAWPLARSVEFGETVQGEEIRIERGDGTRGIIRMNSAPVVDDRGHQLAAVATVFDVTREREQELRHAFLEDATRVLNESLELDATLRSVAKVAVGRYADWCVLYRGSSALLEPITAEHRQAGCCDALQPFLEHPLHDGGGHAANDVVRSRDPHMVADSAAALEAIAGSDEALRAAARTLGCRSVLLLPLVSRERELGALCLVRNDTVYTLGDLELMTELGRRASMAAENALLYEQARAADRAKSSFLAVMSHEFRTPLSAILGYADILTTQLHGDLNPKQVRHLERVKASVRHLSHLVDEILSFASMESARERVVRDRTELRALVADALGIMEPIAEATGLTLEVELPTREIVMRTDGSKVRQIVINLVSNALKYTPEGKVAVQLLETDDGILLHVADTGPGIAAEFAELVFEPFWQVDQSDGRRITGTGLGLAVARQLARLLGGDVTLESEVGKGSRFTLMLPGDPSGVADNRAP